MMMHCQRYNPLSPILAGCLILVYALEILLAFPTPASAYTDPNIGNLVFQILFPIITVLSTAYLFCRNFIKRKINSWKNRFKEGRLNK